MHYTVHQADRISQLYRNPVSYARSSLADIPRRSPHQVFFDTPDILFSWGGRGGTLKTQTQIRQLSLEISKQQSYKQVGYNYF